ncbi:serine hydrolase domain-containing protein [Winogradskyella jejuensis]|uniref:CubicO group peptidase, beta-lactamase class C family n=1 Tax=Winogradskyella jejuensis TaxID=1089305 RepID=A0A1M5M946_9FLAO|nr:serine hydrolase domain-containing protein [Winogradskyella jejuensis]SHG73792.1 CubicO group peptidase, beta-lactamase class C family [Winogradskyella jejuensis]
MKKSLTLFALLISISLVAQQQIKQIDSIVNSKLKDYHPGIAVGIVKNGKIVYEKYRGLSNLQHQIDFNEKTRSNIASTAKQFTALMILHLSLEGKLSLEDDIRKYLPSLYKNVQEKIRIRNVINHTSGIRDYVELLDLEGDVWWKRFGFDNDDAMELLAKQEELGFTPESIKYYSNSNYIVLAKVIEEVTGKSFNEYSKKFFENLGMNETSFVERYMKVIPNRANPYSDWGRGEWWEVPTVTKTNGEGFLFTTLRDQLHFEQAVQNANYNNNILLIKSQQPIPNSKIKRYGFGLELENRFNRKAVHHSGGTYGFHSQTYRFPEEKLSIFIMSNNGNISSNLIAKEIANLILPKVEKKDQYDQLFYANRKEKETLEISGTYSYPSEGKMVEIIEKEGKTYWKEKNFTIELVSVGKNSFLEKNNPKLKVLFYENEMIEFYPSGKTIVYKKRKELPASFSDLEGFVGKYTNNELGIDFQLKLTKDYTLKLKLSNEKRFVDVTMYNRTYLTTNNFFLKVQRDPFKRVSEILLTYGRAKNIRFKKKTNLKFQPKIETDNGSINVTTIGSRNGDTSDILLTKNYANGNEIWYKRFGGKAWDKANSIIDTEDGYLIVGSTSSFGKGNYDMYVIKTDKKGNKLWQNTYGDFYNEYGYMAEKTETGYLIKGTIQKCSSNTDIFNRKCSTNVWFVSIDENGKEISNKVLEEIEN